MIKWVQSLLACPGGTTINQAIGTDGNALYDISQQLNVYDDEHPVLQLSVTIACLHDAEPKWETVFYRNWQRPDAETIDELAKPIVDLAMSDMGRFLTTHGGTDETEANEQCRRPSTPTASLRW